MYSDPKLVYVLKRDPNPNLRPLRKRPHKLSMNEVVQLKKDYNNYLYGGRRSEFIKVKISGLPPALLPIELAKDFRNFIIQLNENGDPDVKLFFTLDKIPMFFYDDSARAGEAVTMILRTPFEQRGNRRENKVFFRHVEIPQRFFETYYIEIVQLGAERTSDHSQHSICTDENNQKPILQITDDCLDGFDFSKLDNIQPVQESFLLQCF